jgi:Taurine catabolism dioxygenase TauD, TfdA family
LILSFDQGPLARSAEDNAPGIERLSPKQLEALDMVLDLAKRYHLKIHTKTGDMLFINNLSIMHARSAFEDQRGSRRHLVRMWIHNDELGWKLPRELQGSFDIIFNSKQKAEELIFLLEPKPEYKAPRITNGTGAGATASTSDSESSESSDQEDTRSGRS